ncbi:MAG: asparaginase [Azospirillaceae bacterium]|nr:asparaginase [Azospirillaceae bacterium]
MTQPRPRILVLSTGGTIAGQAASAAGARYVSGQVGIDTLLEAADSGTGDVDLAGIAIATVGSQDMDRRIWARLHAEIAAAFAQDRADGIVITHGTDTAEETAFLLDLTLPPTRPVVLVGAMRPANALGADGPRNLANAIGVAAAVEAYGRGVLVVMGDAVFEARSVYKAGTNGTDAFRAFPGGPVGAVTPSSLHFFAPATTPRATAAYRLPPPPDWPIVAILHIHADMDLAIVDAILASDVAGVVLAGVGHGNAPRAVLDRLGRAAHRGVAVVRASRIDAGAVARDTEVDDEALGFLAGGTYSPQKCRLLLQLLIANAILDPIARQNAFLNPGA